MEISNEDIKRVEEMRRNKHCRHCVFWAAVGGVYGECGMITAPETLVTIIPRISARDDCYYQPIDGDDERFANVKFNCAMITPEDFSCSAWQELYGSHF